MEQGITVKVPSKCTNTDGLIKVGELNITVKPQDNINNIAGFTTQATDDNVTIILDENSYFCKSITDSTPLNTSEDLSREIILSKTSAKSYFIFFKSESSNIKVSNKYKWSGIGADRNYMNRGIIIANNDSNIFKYCNDMIAFPEKSEIPINHNNISRKVIIAGSCLTSGNYEGFTFGMPDETNFKVHNGSISIEGVSGNINILRYFNYLTLKGDFTYNFPSDGTLIAGSLHLISPNIYGDISHSISKKEHLYIGDINNICHVSFGNSETFKGITIGLRIYSDNLDLNSLKRLIDIELSCGVRSNFTLDIYSTLFSIDEVKKDTDLYNNLLSLSKLTSQGVKINNYIIPKSD